MSETDDVMTPPEQIRSVIAEMNAALSMGALFNPEEFGSMLKAGDNPIRRWRDALLALADHPVEAQPEPDAQGLIRCFLSSLPFPDRLPAVEVAIEDDGDLSFDWGFGSVIVSASLSPIGVVTWAALIDGWKAHGHFTLPGVSREFNEAVTRFGERHSGRPGAAPPETPR